MNLHRIDSSEPDDGVPPRAEHPNRSKGGKVLISVCICTFKRPELLRAALKGIISQKAGKDFTFEIVVSDNDRLKSAEKVVKEFQNNCTGAIRYTHVPEQNIALARNAAVRHAKGSFIAFIDDDEVPSPNWLVGLFTTLTDSQADGALGPVLPRFAETAPRWIRKSNIFDRRRFTTGTVLSVRNTRTGNVLVRKSLFKEGRLWFDPKFGRTGGEDVNFFQRHIDAGRVFVWCDEAQAFEAVPEDRCTMGFHLKKFIRIGATNGERLRKAGFKGAGEMFKIIATLPVKFLMFAVSLPLGRHVWMQYALKTVYAASSIFAYSGIALLRHRE